MFEPVHYSTLDIDLAAYLMLRGAKLMGLVPLSEKRANFVLVHRKVLKFVCDWGGCKMIKFAPKAYCNMRYFLKHETNRAYRKEEKEANSV